MTKTFAKPNLPIIFHSEGGEEYQTKMLSWDTLRIPSAWSKARKRKYFVLLDDVLYLTEQELSDLELRGISQEAAANRKDIFQRTAYLACIKGKKETPRTMHIFYQDCPISENTTRVKNEFTSNFEL